MRYIKTNNLFLFAEPYLTLMNLWVYTKFKLIWNICMSTKASKNGLYTKYFENGQEKIEKNYRDGRLHGKWTEWYENGQKKKEGNYTDGITGGMLDLFDKGSCKQGKWTEWYANGKKALEENYINGQRDGKRTRTEWYENGQKMKQENYNKGEIRREVVDICSLFNI